MKYRIKSIFYRKGAVKHGSIHAKRRFDSSSALTSPFNGNTEKINLDLLFELGVLPSPKPRARIKFFSKRVKSFLSHVGTCFVKALSVIVKPIMLFLSRLGRNGQRLSFYTGVFASAVLVAGIAMITVLAGLFGGYLTPYNEFNVPDVIGEKLSDIESTASENCELLILYENSNDIPSGTVISQKPVGGVTRKLYKNGRPCQLTLVVSAGKSFYTVADFSGQSSRSALLELQNAGISVNKVYIHSATAPENSVISTSPTAGERLYSGEILTVRISLGKKINTATVPDLYGLSEVTARALLEERGLALGKITYRASDTAAGKIISQEFSPYTVLSEGTAINITVSLGRTAGEKTVPELYGLSIEEARKKLAEVGLVIGGIYSVSSGAPSGTVITQTPIAGTQITASVTSVDLFVSS